MELALERHGLLRLTVAPASVRHMCLYLQIGHINTSRKEMCRNEFSPDVPMELGRKEGRPEILSSDLLLDCKEVYYSQLQ